MRIDVEILRGLIHDDHFSTKVLPHIKKDYFQNHHERAMFEFIQNHHLEYRKTPSVEALTVILDDSTLSENIHSSCVDLLADIADAPEKMQTEWLFDRTEEWAKDRALHNGLLEAFSIYEKSGGDTANNLQRTSIPDVLRDSLAVEFKTDVGMDYFGDIEKQYQFYQHSEDETNRFKFDIDILNQITRGGIPRRTSNLCFAGVNTGKTAFLCYLAGMYVQAGLNVLFISCEMQEELIRERIDANILGLATENFYKIKEDLYVKRLKRIQEQTTGSLFIKAYPPLRSNSITYQNLLRELSLKKGFKPDVVLIDYLGIVASSTLPVSAMQNSNLYMGQVSKELRALAVEGDFALWSAHQLNREGMSQVEVEMTHSGGSIDITKDADFILAISQPEEFEQKNQALMKQLKNRYNKKSRLRRFIIGMDTDLMRFYQVEDSVQEGLHEGRQQKRKPRAETETVAAPPVATRGKKTDRKVPSTSDWNM